MRIYTRTGDKGKTRINGGIRLDKDNIRIECMGMFDEVNCNIGLLRVKLPKEDPWQKRLYNFQVDLMEMICHIATEGEKSKGNSIKLNTDGDKNCEIWIDEMLDEMKDYQDYFIVPGGSEISALCQIIRAQIRTSERRLISLHKIDPQQEFILKYINRLSDLFFVLAKYDLFKKGIQEEKLYSFHRKDE